MKTIKSIALAVLVVAGIVFLPHAHAGIFDGLFGGESKTAETPVKSVPTTTVPAVAGKAFPSALKLPGKSNFSVNLEHRRRSDYLPLFSSRWSKDTDAWTELGRNVPVGSALVTAEGRNEVRATLGVYRRDLDENKEDNVVISDRTFNCSNITANIRYQVRHVWTEPPTTPVQVERMTSMLSGSPDPSGVSDGYCLFGGTLNSDVIQEALDTSPQDANGMKSIQIYMELASESPTTAWVEQTSLILRTQAADGDNPFFYHNDSGGYGGWTPFTIR